MKIELKKQNGFSLIESLVVLTILVFVFNSFITVMLRSAIVANRTNSQVEIEFLLDNRVEESWITGQNMDLSPTGNINFSTTATELIGRNIMLNIEQKRIYAVSP